MIRAFLDTNVIVDFLTQREGFYGSAAIIISLAKHKKIKIYAASMSFATASYLMAKHYHNDVAAIKLAFSNLMKYCNVALVDKATVEAAIASSFNDFEDGMQNACATACKADYFITRNTGDFKNSAIRVVTPNDFLKILVAPNSAQQ